MSPQISLIMALDEQGGMGLNNRLPWHLPAELAYFKAVTMGKPIVMGRKTFESIGRPLPGRLNLVLSRKTFEAEGVTVVSGLDAALRVAQDAPEVMVIGGMAVYQAALPYASKLYLTRVHHVFEADVFFPELDWHAWHLAHREERKSDDKNAYDMSFHTYDRVIEIK
jgi:dihydrofolate reductase